MLQLTFVMRDTDFAASAMRGGRRHHVIPSARSAATRSADCDPLDHAVPRWGAIRVSKICGESHPFPGVSGSRFNDDVEPRAPSTGCRKERFRVRGWRNAYETITSSAQKSLVFLTGRILRAQDTFWPFIHTRTRREFIVVSRCCPRSLRDYLIVQGPKFKDLRKVMRIFFFYGGILL